MNSSFQRPQAGIAILGAFMAALMLAGCGRKGPLDLPPSAAVAQPGPGQPGPDHSGQVQPGHPDAHFDAEGRPVAPPAKDSRPFILDGLLD